MGQRPRPCGYSRLMASYPSVAKVSWRFPNTKDRKYIGTSTQRNRRSDVIKCSWKPRNDNVSPARQSGQGVLPHACWLESASNWQVDKSGSCSILQSRDNVDWLTFASDIFTPLFVESMMESFMTSSTRRLQWRGTMPHTVEYGKPPAPRYNHLARDNRHMWPLQNLCEENVEGSKSATSGWSYSLTSQKSTPSTQGFLG